MASLRNSDFHVRDYMAGDCTMMCWDHDKPYGAPLSKPAVTMLWKDRIILVGGVADVGEDRGTAWAIVGDIPARAIRHIMAYGRAYLTQAKTNITRLDALCDPHLHGAIRTLEFLGFEIEATLESFANGQDRCIAIYRGSKEKVLL